MAQKITSYLNNLIPFLFSLLLFLVPLVFYPKTSEIFEFNKMILVYIFTILIASVWIIKMIITKRIIFERSIMDLPILAFLISQALSTLISIDPHTSLYGYYSRFHGGLLSTISYSLLYWAYVSNMQKKWTINTLKVILVSSAVVSIYAIFEHFGHSLSCLLISGKFDANCWVQDVQLRVFASMGQPNWLGALLVVLSPFSWAMALNSKLKTKNFLFYLGLSFLLFVTLLFTKSRSSLLAFAVESAIFWLLILASSYKKYLKKFLILNIALIILCLSFGTPWSPKLSDIYKNYLAPAAKPSAEVGTVTNSLEEGGTESGAIRQIVWRGAIDIWKHYPLFGTGVETFAFSYYQFRPVEHNLVSEWDFLYNKAHNEYLNMAANSGTLGLLTYSMLILFTISLLLKYPFKIPKNSSSQLDKQNTKLLIAAILSSYVSILITNFFGFSVVTIGLYFFLLPAFAVTVINLPIVGKVSIPKKILFNQYLLIAPVIFVTLYLLFTTSRYWHADTLYQEGRQLNDKDPVAAAKVLHRAVNLSPDEPNYKDELSQAFTTIAVSLDEAGKKEDAKTFIKYAIDEGEEAVNQNPRNMNIRRSNANMYTKLSEIDHHYLLNALQVISGSIPYAPTDAKFYFHLGLTYGRLGQIEEAVKNFEKAIELKVNYKDARLAAALMYEEKGELGKAKEELEYILKNISPLDKFVQDELKKVNDKKV